MITGKRPFLVTGTISGLVAIVGVVSVACGLIRSDDTTLLFGAILGIGGMLGVLGSLFGQYVQRIYQLQQNLPFYEVRSAKRRPPSSPND